MSKMNREKFQNMFSTWFLKNTSDLIILLSKKGEIICISNTAANFYGLDIDVICGNNYFKLLAESAIEPPVPEFTLKKLTNENSFIDKEIDTILNDRKYTLTWSINLLNDSSNSQAYVFLGKDITQQRDAERSAKNTALNLEHIISCMPGNVYWFDKNNVCLGANDNVAKMLGFKSSKEVVGKTYEDLSALAGWTEGQGESFKKDDMEVIRTGKPKLNVEEPPIMNHNGEKIYFLTSRVPLRDENNQITGVVGISIDITKRKYIEEALKKAKETAEQANKEKLALLAQLNKEVIGKSANQYETVEEYAYSIRRHLKNIIACMPGHVYWMDKNCVYMGCNDNVARMMGAKSPDEIAGVTYDVLAKLSGWTEAQASSFKKDDLEVIQTKQPKLNVEEPPVKDRNGNTVYFLTSRVPLFDESNQVTGVVGISIDITERKRMEEELRKAKEQAEASNRAKSEFLANMSHDVKTPLSGIIALSELLTPLLQDEYCSLAQEIMASGKNLMTFFENCIELSKLESGSFTLSEETFSLKKLINEIAQLFRPTVRAKGLGMYIDYSEEIPPRLLGNRANLYRVLLNLMGNAIKFTNKGSITIRVQLDKEPTPDKASIELSVIDTGIGIPKEKQTAIFERFSRVTPSYQGVYEGSGIGLNIVQKFVHMMDGEISVKSKEGKGSQFTVVVPLQIVPVTDNEHEDEVDSSPVLPQALTISPGTKIKENKPYMIPNVPVEPIGTFQPNILLVEDNVTTQKVTATLFHSLGCKVDIASCGEEAIALFQPGKYHLVFTDIGLPDMEGYEVSVRIREMEKDTISYVPILGLSAHVEKKEKTLSAQAGMDEMLAKPLLSEQVKAVLANYVFFTDAPCEKHLENVNLPVLESSLKIINLEKSRINTDSKTQADWEVLVEFIEILPGDVAEIKQAYQLRDMKLLKDKVHKLHGALYYTHTPQLLETAKELETSLKNEQYQELDKLYQNFLKAVDTLNETYKSLQG